MFESFREKLQTVGQDFTSGIKTLGESKDVKIKKKQRQEEHLHLHLPHFSAGVEVLSRYEDAWVTLHRRAKESAKAGETVDGEVVMLTAHWARRRAALSDLQEQLQQLPSFLNDLQTITTRIAHLEGDFEEMESRLAYLENLCGQSDQLSLQHHQLLQLENYRRKKRKDLEAFKGELDSQHALQVQQEEQVQVQQLKERQRFYEEAFRQDMDHYLSSTLTPDPDPDPDLNLHTHEPVSSQASGPGGGGARAGGGQDALEQMDVTDVLDHEALDVFLNSDDVINSDDISIASSLTSGPDPDWSWETSLQLPSQSESRAKLSSTCSDSINQDTEGQEEDVSDGPLIQSDEEEVQADTLGAELKNSDDSDSTAPLTPPPMLTPPLPYPDSSPSPPPPPSLS